MVFKPWSYATIIALPFWLGPLLHGDMVVPIWHTMAKTAKFGKKWPALMIPYLHGHGQDPSNPRCYRHMEPRSQHMPLADPHGRLQLFSPLQGKWHTNGAEWQHTPNWVTHNSPFKRRGHMRKHPIRCGFMCPLRIALTLGQVAHATSDQTLRGRRGLWPFWAKGPKFTQK